MVTCYSKTFSCNRLLSGKILLVTSKIDVYGTKIERERLVGEKYTTLKETGTVGEDVINFQRERRDVPRFYHHQVHIVQFSVLFYHVNHHRHLHLHGIVGTQTPW